MSWCLMIHEANVCTLSTNDYHWTVFIEVCFLDMRMELCIAYYAEMFSGRLGNTDRRGCAL